MTHLYADDIQAFVHGSPINQLALVSSVDALTHDLHSWISSNRLCLNSAKTQLIWFGTRQQQLLKLDFPLLTNRFPSFTYSSSVRDLGVILDSFLTFSDHISTLTRSCYFHLRRLRAIRRSITPTVFATLVHAFICSRIDYCNSLLMDLLKSRLSAIQSVLNAAARLIARLPRFTHISTCMTEVLHWLAIASRIKFKVFLLVSKSQLGLAPSYLTDFMRKPMSSTSACLLRSTDCLDLFVPRVRTALAQCRAFAVTTSWNGLPCLLRAKLTSGISATFCHSLKTFLFPLELPH